MATSNANQNPIGIEGYLRDLLECPVCMETIKSVPVYQCANGHVSCKDCIAKLNNCPICRNDSELRRSLKLENIVQRLEGIQPENEKTTTPNPNLQNWGKGSIRVYGTINGSNQDPHMELNVQTIPEALSPLASDEEDVEKTLEAIAIFFLIIMCCAFYFFPKVFFPTACEKSTRC